MNETATEAEKPLTVQDKLVLTELIETVSERVREHTDQVCSNLDGISDEEYAFVSYVAVYFRPHCFLMVSVRDLNGEPIPEEKWKLELFTDEYTELDDPVLSATEEQHPGVVEFAKLLYAIARDGSTGERADALSALTESMQTWSAHIKREKEIDDDENKSP